MVLKQYTNQLDHFSINKQEYVFDYFDHIDWSKQILLWDKADLHYVAVLYNSTIELECLCQWLSCNARLSVIVVSHDAHPAGWSVSWILSHNHTSVDIHMLSVLTDQSIVSADGRIDIRPGISKVHGSLLEEYLIVGSDVSVKTLPMLDVQSSDVTASHGARIERIDDKKLFYMMSKGISKSDASRLMIQWVIGNLFDLVRDSDPATVDEIQDRIIQLVYDASY